MKLILNALSIDAAKQKWVFRGLFLFIFVCTALSMYWPIGNPDVSASLVWWEETVEYINSLPLGVRPEIQIPRVVFDNLLFAVSQMILTVLLVLGLLFTFALYFADAKGITARDALSMFFRRLFFVILFLGVTFAMYIAVSFFFAVFGASSLFTIIVMFAIATFLLAPGLVVFEKTNPILALIMSWRATRRKQLYVVFHIGAISGLYYLGQFVLVPMFGDSTIGWAVICGFLTAYFTLSFAKMMALFFARFQEGDIIKREEVKEGGGLL